MANETSGIAKHRVVSHDEWAAARTAFLAKEKEFTRLRDELAEQRRDLPWEAITKEYVFDGPNGKVTLRELFRGRSQLVVYHFMFDPSWDAGCPHCSRWADSFNGAIVHLNQRDVTMVAMSRAPREKLDAFEKRMGWSFKWLSSGGSDFNYDFGASFTDENKKKPVFNYGTMVPGGNDREGMSVFYKNENGEIFHTYSSYARGIDMFNTAYHYLDACPKGRDEDKLPFTQAWVKHHDRYQ